MKNEQVADISCSIFRKQETVTKEIIDRINQIQQIEEKAALADELEKEVNVLLSCQDYNNEKPDCRNCEFITNLRKKTADLIIKANKLA